jgi:hypothetical protein
MEQFSWKPASYQLYQQISEEIGRTLDDLNFPETQFTGRPVARTATQEQLANASGTEGLYETIRHMEVCYAEQAHIVLSMIRAEFTDDKIDAMIGPLDRQKIRVAWNKIGVPDRLPNVRFSANARSRNAERAKLLMDLHERTMADVDPMTGLPRYETQYALEEAHISVGLGKPEKYQPTKQERMAMIEAKARAAMEANGGGGSGGQPGQAAPGGKTRDSQGKPRGRRENAGRRDSSRGRDRGAPVGSSGDTKQ